MPDDDRNSEFWQQIRRAVAERAAQMPRTGKLLACPKCDTRFMEIAIKESRNLNLAEHLFWEHELDGQQVMDELAKVDA